MRENRGNTGPTAARPGRPQHGAPAAVRPTACAETPDLTHCPIPMMRDATKFAPLSAATPLLPQGPGETPMPTAPLLRLHDGRACFPQHYLQYQQTAHTLADIVSHIDYCDSMPVFADHDVNGLYLQVGLVGRENYERHLLPRPLKLVYGRRWRIESYTPTSEVIQTVLLALKKACEHEVRELLTVHDAATGKPATPFSCHQDLPLLAGHRDLLAPAERAPAASLLDLAGWLAPLRFDQRAIALVDASARGAGGAIVELRLGRAPSARQNEGATAQFDELALTLVLRELSRTELLYELIDALIKQSDRHVEENFRYRGFARFARVLDPLRVAALSVASRPYARDMGDAAFAPVFREINNTVDAQRAPSLGAGALAALNRDKLERCGPLAGHMPQGYAAGHGASAPGTAAHR